MQNPYSHSDIFWIVIYFTFTMLGAIVGWQTGTHLWITWFAATGTVLMLLLPVMMQRTISKKESVEFDQHSIRRYMASGQVESITWDELDEIGIVTTDDGPGMDDVFWLFMNTDRSKGCAVSNDALGFPALLEKLQRLPNFDNEALIKAMGSASDQSFVVWKRSDEQQRGHIGLSFHSAVHDEMQA